MKVKLTRREQRPETVENGIHAYGKFGTGSYARNAWYAIHDAAPDDATRALVDLLTELRSQGERIPPAVRVKARAFATTPEGAALIRQAEEQGRD